MKGRLHVGPAALIESHPHPPVLHCGAAHTRNLLPMTAPHTATACARLLSERKISSRELLSIALETVDAKEPTIGAFITQADREQLTISAKRIDNLRAGGESVPPLAGIPIAIKDNIALKDELLTCGSRILANYRSPYSATVVQRVKSAGLLILGKTNMDEFGFGSSTENSAFHLTRNPHDQTRVPGGTSGGSAAAVAADFVPFALGTDTGGSVRQPAAMCGVAGMRPTYGRVSRYGLVSYASSMDQVGPIANTVEDVALLLDLIAGGDSMDSTSLPEEFRLLPLDKNTLRLGIPREYMIAGSDAAVLDAVAEVGRAAKA